LIEAKERKEKKSILVLSRKNQKYLLKLLLLVDFIWNESIIKNFEETLDVSFIQLICFNNFIKSMQKYHSELIYH